MLVTLPLRFLRGQSFINILPLRPAPKPSVRLSTGRAEAAAAPHLVSNPSSDRRGITTLPATVSMARTDFRVYNSMTQQKEVFKTREPGKVGMYVCGITAYDLSHLGHARAAVSFDVLYRFLLYLGYEVNYVRNFTDVDDKIISRANELGIDPLSLSSDFCEEFLHDMDDLQCLHPTHQPRVSDHLDQIQHMIKQIMENGHAYAIDGDVYFSVDKLPNYGRLSRQKVEENRAGERVAIDTRKRNPADFALWKGAKPDEPSWQSPWGPGRPGWHIECSAMSARFLSFTFDIHGGGIDLIFPHHENEIAQSYAVCHESEVSYWMHNGHVTNNNEKMSKSLGNFFTIREITKSYHPLALRHFLLSAHYRSHLNYTVSQLESASDSVYYIYQTLKDCESVISPYQDELIEKTQPNCKTIRTSPSAKECIDKLHSDFESKMSDDLLTPPVLNGSLVDTLRFMNSSLKTLMKRKQKQQLPPVIVSLVELERQVRQVLGVFGLLSPAPYSEVLGQLKGKALKRAGVGEGEVLQLIEERTLLRKKREYAKGDEIRKSLSEKGIMLMDEGDLTLWRPRTILDHDSS